MSAGKCWCSELYEQDELSVLSKTSLSCAKVLTRVGGVGSVKPITPSADPVPLSACDLHSRGDDNAIILLLEMAN